MKRVLKKLAGVLFAGLFIWNSAAALTDPEPNPFENLESGEQVFEGEVTITDGEILSVRSPTEEEFLGRFDQILKYRDGGGPAAANEFFVGDRVRVLVDESGVVRAAQNFELLLCDQTFYGWIREPQESTFVLERVDGSTVIVRIGPTTQFRDEGGALLFGYTPRESDSVRLHGVVNTNANEVFTETFGAYISLLSEEALAPFVEEAAAKRAVADEPEFTDVAATHEFFTATQFVKQKTIVDGYADGTFRPDALINRAEFTKILIGASGSAITMEVEESCFPDVPAEEWFASFVCHAKNESILGGYPDGTFRPAATINLAEAATILVKTFGFTTDPAADDEEWFEPFLAKAEQLQILPSDFAEPGEPLTRGQMSELVMRAIKYIRGDLLDYIDALAAKVIEAETATEPLVEN